MRRAFEQVAATQLQACWEVFYPDKGSHAQNGLLASLLNGDWNVAQKVKALDVPFLYFFLQVLSLNKNFDHRPPGSPTDRGRQISRDFL